MTPASVLRSAFLVSTILSLVGCSTWFGNRVADVDSTQAQRVRQLERELKKRQAAFEEMRERNLVLEQRVRSQKSTDGSIQVSQQMSQPTGQQMPAQQMAQQQPAKPLPRRLPAYISRHRETPVTPAAQELSPPQQEPAAGETAAAAPSAVQSGEQRLYSKVLESYRAHNTLDLEKSIALLLKAYPDSIYADNALYLGGLLAFEKNDGARSLAYMDRVVREYPSGNKAVSAMFAKAMVEKRARRYRQATEILRDIRSQFPGSPEAARAESESKIIGMALSNGREG